LGIFSASGNIFGSYDVIEVRVHSQSSVRVLWWVLFDDFCFLLSSVFLCCMVFLFFFARYVFNDSFGVV